MSHNQNPCFKLTALALMTCLVCSQALGAPSTIRMEIGAANALPVDPGVFQALQVESLPTFSTVKFSDGRELVLEKTHDELRYFDATDPTVEGNISVEELASIGVGQFIELGGGVSHGVIRAENRLGGSSSLQATVRQNMPGSFSVVLRTVQGEIVGDYEVGFAVGGQGAVHDQIGNQSASAVLVIVITAAGVAALGCTLAAILTNCIDDCSDACQSESGCSMMSASEGWCGTCTCACQCPEGDPGFEPIF